MVKIEGIVRSRVGVGVNERRGGGNRAGVGLIFFMKIGKRFQGGFTADDEGFKVDGKY